MNLLKRPSPSRRVASLRLGALVAGTALLATAATGVSAFSAGAAVGDHTTNISTGPLDILLGVGVDESQRIASWYFPSNVAQSLEIEKSSDLAAGEFDGDKLTIAASKAANNAADTSTTDSNTSGISGIANQSGYINAHATIKDLAPNTTYSYHVGASDGSAWSPTYTFSTKSFTGDFDFIFFGDPQIGSSGFTDDDALGWANTLNYATTSDPKAELLVSGGDQIEHANNEYEWSAFADSSSILKQYPWAATIGNHDVGGKAYEQHNQVPNSLKTPDFYPGGNTTTNSGGDYWYIFKGVLFIDINSNAYAGGSDAEHVSYVRGVINRYGDKAKWTALVYHHSIYSPADHANDPDNQQRRYDFTTAFSKLGVDIVLQGHDHSYSRSYAILKGKKANPDEQPGASEVFAGPGGVIYVTANSASGSKYYDLTAPDPTQSGYGADPLDPTGKRHWANSVENQEHVRTFIKVSVTDSKLDVTDVRAGDCSAPNSAVTNGKVATCGVTLQPTASADPAAIGSTVDHFTLDTAVPSTTTALTLSQGSRALGSTTPVTVTATVGGGLGTVSGDVTFYDGDTKLGTKPVAAGSASYVLPDDLGLGGHEITAKFESDSVFTGTGSTSSVATFVVTKFVSTTTLKYSKGAVSISVKAPGTSVKGTAKVYDGSHLVKTVKISSGKGTTKLTLKKGTHKLHAVFVTTSTIAASTSSTVTVKIAR